MVNNEMMNNEDSKIEALLSLTYEGYSPTEFIGEGLTAYVLKVEKAGEVKAVKIPKKSIFHDIIRDGIKPLIELRGHPNIVEVYGDHCFEHDHGFPYYIMEFLDGQNLEQRLGENSRIGLDVDEAVNIMVGVANGIRYAHSKNIIHSDLRPPNVQITKKGVIKLTDFDLYRLALNKNNPPEILREFKEHKYSIEDRAGNPMDSIKPCKDWLSYKAREGIFTEQLDIFQFSKMLYQTLTGDIVSGIPKPLSKRLGKEFIMLDEIINRGYADNENDIDIALKEIIDILQSVRYIGDLPIFNNKISNLNMQFDFSLENIVGISIPKGPEEINDDREIRRRTEQMTGETDKMLRNIKFLVTNYSDLINFVHKKKMTSLSRVSEQINRIDAQMDQRMKYDARAITKFINDRIVKDENGEAVKDEKGKKQYFFYDNVDFQLRDSFKEYLESLKKAPKEIIQLAKNANLIG